MYCGKILCKNEKVRMAAENVISKGLIIKMHEQRIHKVYDKLKFLFWLNDYCKNAASKQQYKKHTLKIENITVEKCVLLE